MWDWVDSALCLDKKNGRSSTIHVVMLGNTPVVSNATLQTSVKKSTYGSECVACEQAIYAVMTTRNQFRCFGCTVDEDSRIFCDNKGVILAGCGMIMLIKKRSASLEFHKTRATFLAGVIELQHTGGDKNSPYFFNKGCG